MNKAKAMKEAKRRFGKTAAIQDYGAVLVRTPEQRMAAKAELKRMQETLTKEEQKLRQKERDALFSTAHHYRYSVGKIALGMFFAVEGEGDSWEEAFFDADRHAARNHDDFLNRRKAA